MNRRLALGILGLAAVIGVAAAFWLLRGREGAEAPAGIKATGALRATSRWGEGPPAPVPALSLQVNRSGELELEQGTALILAVRAANPRARNYASGQRDPAPVPGQEGTPDSAEPPAPKLKAGVRSLTLGTPQQGWDELLRFHLRDPTGSLRPAEWPIRLLRVEPPVAQLDVSSSAEAVFALAPEAARTLPPGCYELVARLEVPGAASPGDWHGAVESRPVNLTIVAAGAPPARQRMRLANARYYLETGDPAQASKLAGEAAEADPGSPEAWILVGDAKLGAGDKEGALAGYDRAAAEYGKHPSGHEVPRALMWRIKKLERP
jgi:hypothetical protein